jgi:hypothetical protein
MKHFFKLLTVIAIVGLFTTSAIAAEFKLYGTAWFETVYVSSESGYNQDNSTNKLDTADADFNVALDTGNSKFGADVTASDELSGKVEINAAGGIRLFYGKWKISDTTSLLVGHDWAPITFLNGTSYYKTLMLDDGALSSVRQNQIRIDTKLAEGMTLKVGLLNPSTVGADKATYVYTKYSEIYKRDFNGDGDYDDEDETEVEEGYLTSVKCNVDTTIPKIELNFGADLGVAKLNLFGGYNSVTSVPNKEKATTTVTESDIDGVETEETKTAETKSLTITSYVAGFNANVAVDAFSISFLGWYAQNATNYGIHLSSTAAGQGQYTKSPKFIADDYSLSWISPYRTSIQSASTAVANDSDGDLINDEVLNATTMGILLVPGFKVSDTVGLNLNIGYVTATSGKSKEVTLTDGTKKTVDAEPVNQLTVALTAKIELAKGVVIVPEVGQRSVTYTAEDEDYDGTKDKDDDWEDEAPATETWVGVVWLLSF